MKRGKTRQENTNLEHKCPYQNLCFSFPAPNYLKSFALNMKKQDKECGCF